MQVVYATDGHYVSVFEQAGELEDDAMAVDLTPLDDPASTAWQADDGSVIVRRSDVVYVLVGDIDPDDAGRRSWPTCPTPGRWASTRRIGDAMDDLVDRLRAGLIP